MKLRQNHICLLNWILLISLNLIYIFICCMKFKIWLIVKIKIFCCYHFVFIYLQCVVFAMIYFSNLHHRTSTIVSALRSNTQEQFNAGVDYTLTTKMERLCMAINCCRYNVSTKGLSLTSLLPESEESKIHTPPWSHVGDAHRTHKIFCAGPSHERVSCYTMELSLN